VVCEVKCQMLQREPEDNFATSRMLTVSEVAHLLHVHVNTIRLWCKIGVLKSYRIGQRRDYRFNLEDVETFLHKDDQQEKLPASPPIEK
jgi:excisionase family DNA binding protein